MPLDKKTIQNIRASFPPEAIQSVKKYKNADTGDWVELLGYKPPYVIERLNDVFGHEGWDFTILEHGITTASVWVKGRLTVYATNHHDKKEHPDYPFTKTVMTVKEQFGHCGLNKALPLGDGLKGATTNCLEKSASMLDVGHEAYKGQLTKPKVALTPEEELKEARKILSEECKKVDIGKDTFVSLTKTVLDLEIEANKVKTLSLEDVNKLIAHVQKTGSPF